MLNQPNTNSATAQQQDVQIANHAAMEHLNNDELRHTPLDRIIPIHLGNCRSKRNSDKFAELKTSIAAQGVFQAVVVRPHSDIEGMYELVAGFGRFEASVELGLSTIPTMIRQLSDREALEIQIQENSNREDLGIVDEARVAKKWLAFYEGDRSAAAQRLGWPRKKLNERLELNRCTSEILAALEIGSIKCGHAMILASFTAKRQDATLKTILTEKWTVEYLKERAGKAQRYLAQAKFDIAGCSGCDHNSEAQAGLFDTDDRAKCSNIECFRSKTNDWLAERRKALEEQHGKVLLLVEVDAQDRNTVDASVVGEEQFKTGCTGCQSNCVLLDDRPQKEGGIVTNQCLDASCFNKQAKANSQIKTKQEAKAQATTSTEVKPTASSKKQTTDKPVVQKTNRKIIERNRNHLRQVAATEMLNEASFKQGVVLALLCDRSGHKPTLPNWPDSPTNFSQFVKACIGQDPKAMQDEINKALVYLATKATHNEHRTGEQFIDLMLSAFSTQSDHQAVATLAWAPTAEMLKDYTTDQIAEICESSGFSKAYNDIHKDGFKKLANARKSDFIKQVMEFEFDWSHFAPTKGYLELIK
ncbi:PRTRC system ParB family protein [Neiella marina]|uniref:PRTRC system ParB family protein n=1 Tax=Neiella holothuriorum TaxID=2870530 RepID=A0ABS7EG90_9GAMM|nr:PRTRC system ParB family protein [Neiella holothuriorum]MBW8191335.1 PRTRC system ParB family protein [Neiella holothuriorum]